MDPTVAGWGYRTANEMAINLPSWYNRVNRDRFFREVGEAIKKAEKETGSAALDRR